WVARPRRVNTLSLSGQGLPVLFRQEPGGHRRSSGAAEEHAARFSFPHQTAHGRGRATEGEARVLEIDRARRADAEEDVIAELEANEEFRRHEFPICARKIYCAHTADAPLPRRVAEAMRDAIEDASTHEKQFDKALNFIADTRQLVASFLGTETEEISLIGPTSSGLNAVANGLDWRAGDDVVCYLDDYPADVYPWLDLERHGVKPVLLHTDRIGEITS